MSNIGKVFIVINLVLSILFLAIAATLLAQRWDYRQMYLQETFKYEQDKKNLITERDTARAKNKHIAKYLEQAKKSADEYKEKYLDLKRKHEDLTRINDASQVSLSKINKNIEEINKKLAKKETRISQLETEKEQQKDLAEEARKAKEEALDEQQRIELQLGNMQGELADKEKMLQRAEKELWEAKQIIRAVQAAGVNIPSLFNPAKPLDGLIDAVSNQVPIVMISLGSDDGVQKGYQFTVYRGSHYIGRVTVEEVFKDMCAARIIKDMSVKAIKKGDRVTTKIGGGGNF